MAFSGQLLQHILWSKPEFSRSRSIPLLKTNHEPVKILSQRKLDIRGIKRKSNCLVTFSMSNPFSMSHPDNDTSPCSPSDTIKKFYSSINNNDLNQLALLISEDCFFDDFSYTRPFKGRKEAMKFLEKLTTCMGKNTKFCIEQIYEGVHLTTVVNWHLEWKKKQVPFTRGCSCYELSRDGEQLIIKKAQVIIESPIKPGSFALDVFQNVISVFDTFPEAACMLISLIFFILSLTRERKYSERGKIFFLRRVVLDESPSGTNYLQYGSQAKHRSDYCLVPQVMEYHSHHSYTYLQVIPLHYRDVPQVEDMHSLPIQEAGQHFNDLFFLHKDSRQR